jgi:hypothetical protein
MILGKGIFFQKDHLETNQGLSFPYLSELVVYCLELVSQLSYHGLEYRFKGGNSLLVLLENPQRFSIDVDIATTVSKDEMTAVVAKIVEDCELFTRFESRAPKTKPWLPLISYKIYFDSHYQKPEEAYVMLDAVLEEPPYPGIKKRIRCLDLYESNMFVEVPTVSGLIGDKLLTIGPSTLGIPLGKGKEAHRLKHIFDIALLAGEGYEIQEVLKSVQGCMQQENEIQKTGFSLSAVLEDTREFCRQPLEYPEIPDPEKLDDKTYIYETAVGFEDFRKHLFGREYPWKDFQEDCRTILSLLDEIEKAT